MFTKTADTKGGPVGRIIPLPVAPVPVADHRLAPRLAAVVAAVVERFRTIMIDAALSKLVCPGDLFAEEPRIHALVAKECVDPVMGERIAEAIKDPSVEARAEAVLEASPHARGQKSRQRVEISLLGNGHVAVETPYFLRRPPGRPGKKRRRGQRGKSGNGIYPLLEALGIHDRLTPALAAEVVRTAVTGSFDEAKEELARRGIRRDKKSILRMVRIVSRRALAYRERRIEDPRPSQGRSPVAGKRLGIFLDGGRLRVRLKKRGRRRKNKGKSFRADWREPRVLVLCELDERGRKARDGFVRYEATMGDADETFVLLEAVLREIGATGANQWVIGADGALWIWRRVAELVAKLGYPEAQVAELVDFWHAVGYLWEFAADRVSWTEGERKSWVLVQRRRLKAGKVDQVTEEMRGHCHGRNAKKLKKVVDRFDENRDRMRYPDMRAMGLPCGTGVVESAVRRIVNLRLKGVGIFWRPENAEGMLHLRAVYLSGRWDEYMQTIFEPEQFWRRHPSRIAAPAAACVELRKAA